MSTSLGDMRNIVVVMGMTGSGKSTLIKNITGHDVVIGNDLESCTASVGGYQFLLDGTVVTLVDTPGFDDTHRTDTEVLAEIHGWLSTSSQSNLMPKGILFLHKITDNRMSGSSIKFLRMFRDLCGDDCLQNVTLVTTMWSIVNTEDGEHRHRDLCENYWEPLILNNAMVGKYDSDNTIKRIITNMIGMDSAKLKIMVETEDKGFQLKETSAAQVINEDLIKAQAAFEEEKQTLITEKEKAIDEGNKKLQKYYENAEKEIKEKEAKHKRDIETMEKRNAELRKEHQKKMRNLQQSSAQKRIFKRVLGGFAVATGSALAFLAPPLGVPLAVAGGGLVGSSFADKEVPNE